MDIHQCRFIPFPASAINTAAFTHTSLPADKSIKKSPNLQVRLAIGRSNGDLEIWNPTGWHQELVILGGKDRSGIEGLVWVTDPDEKLADGAIIHGRSRLFSIGHTPDITEWDLERATVKKVASGQHGDIWCLAARPPSNTDRPSTHLVGGTSDGNLLLYSIEDGDLRFERSITRNSSTKAQFISMAFQKRDVVIVGCSNSTICAFNVATGALVRRMSLGADLSGGSKNIVAWAVACLRSGDIVSGDSTGHVCIWDGKTYTQTQRIQSHKQDVLCLAVSADGSRFMSGGMDRYTAIYSGKSGKRGRWSKTFHRKYHTHEVRAMAPFEDANMSVVVSGGPDATPIVMPLRAAGAQYHRRLPHLPQMTMLQSAPAARFVLSWWANEMQVWHLPKTAELLFSQKAATELGKNKKLLAKILVKGEFAITSAAISQDGTLLVTSTDKEIKAFQLRFVDGEPPEIRTVQLALRTKGAKRVEISPDKRWLSWIEESSRVHIAEIRLTEAGYSISQHRKLRRITRQIPKHVLLGGLGSYDRTITQVAFSPDGKVLCVADLAGYIDGWVLRTPDKDANGTNGADGIEDDAESSSSDSEDEDKEEANGHAAGDQWMLMAHSKALPKLQAAPVVLSFSPVSQSEDDYDLLVVTVQKTLLVLNPVHGRLSAWSRRNTDRLPEVFKTTLDVVKGVVWQGTRAWIYSSAFLCMIDLAEDFAKTMAGTKRKWGGASSGAGQSMKKRHALAPTRVTIATGPKGENRIEVNIEGSGDVEDEDEGTNGGELAKMREGETNGNPANAVKDKSNWWHTYMYRPILGIVPLYDFSVRVPESKRNVAELVLVERPLWDITLPPSVIDEEEPER